MTSHRYFVTGTDTDIGKTVVSTILAVGLGADYWKPIQSGASETSDSEFVGKWIGSERVRAEVYKLAAPVAPDLAAHLEGKRIDLNRIASVYECESATESLIIEGAGGVLVPIDERKLLIDLITLLGLPVVVVASTRVGTINHTLLTLGALAFRGLAVTGFVMVGPEAKAAQISIERISGVRCLGRIPRTENFSKLWFQQTFERLSLPGMEMKEGVL